MLEQLYFYMHEASPDLIEDRREYIERVIISKLKRGIEVQNQWSEVVRNEPDSVELINAYRAGLNFFTEKGFNSTQVA